MITPLEVYIVEFHEEVHDSVRVGSSVKDISDYVELVDSKTLRRIQANASAKEAILKNANKREFRRMVVIDRGQPKPKL